MRRNDEGGSGGSQPQDGESPRRPERQHPPTGPDDQSQSPREMELPDEKRAGHGSPTVNVARGLRLLAPHLNSDVANELDLLDMVDEDEQYEIVRSFAAKHIVPHMTGQGL